MQFREWLQNESSEPFMTLYRVNKGGEVNPDAIGVYSRGGMPEQQGVFLSKQPYMVATMHGIRTGRRGAGNLNAYKIHRSIKKEPGIFAGVYDGAWEMFVPVNVWKDYKEKGLIQYLGFSGKEAERQGRPQTMRVATANNMVIKKIADSINKVKQFVLDNNMQKKTMREILAAYLDTFTFPDRHTASYYNQSYNINDEVVKQAESLFNNNGVPYRKERPVWTPM